MLINMLLTNSPPLDRDARGVEPCNMRIVLTSRFRQLALFVLLAGCHANSIDCGQITQSNRIVIHESGASDHEITNSAQIASLQSFANARRECSTPIDTMPASKMTASFYRDSKFLGALGEGSNFFVVACSKGRGVRPATSSELAGFSKLLGREN
jgi:hypothetical protein